MAGEAKTSAFMLGTATVMLGPIVDVFNLTPAEHSIGLVKNFALTAEPQNLDLTHGAKNTIVYSVQTNFPVKATFEVYEFTSKNLAYGLTLDGSGYSVRTGASALAASITAAATVLTISSATDISAAYPVGDWMILQDRSGGFDLVHVAKITASVYDAGTDILTVTFADHAIPTGVTFTTTATARPVNALNIGGSSTQATLGAKIVGILPEDNQPVTVILPKVKILKGFNMSFVTDNYGNMPFELTPFELTQADPHYAVLQAQGGGFGMLFTGN